MAGMPWEDYSAEPAEESGPWSDYTAPSAPLNLSTDQTMSGGFESPGGPVHHESTNTGRSEKEVDDWAAREKQKQVEASPYFDKE
jgi:hypothetical protein